eukprot:m.94429 g.94429  ORF g.94429 m.94429 type:complete len:64 (+) comp15002_c0_seq43:3448-3639(+)
MCISTQMLGCHLMAYRIEMKRKLYRRFAKRGKGDLNGVCGTMAVLDATCTCVIRWRQCLTQHD